MSATNSTSNFELPLFIGTDKPAWLTDWNGAMTTIDAKIQEAKTEAASASTESGSNTQSITQINSTLQTLNSTLSVMNTNVTKVVDAFGAWKTEQLSTFGTNYSGTMFTTYNKNFGILSLYGVVTKTAAIANNDVVITLPEYLRPSAGGGGASTNIYNFMQCKKSNDDKNVWVGGLIFSDGRVQVSGQPVDSYQNGFIRIILACGSWGNGWASL